MRYGKLETEPAKQKLELLAIPVAEPVRVLGNDAIQVTPIDPGLADTAAFCAHYEIPLENSANCVVLEANRGERTWFAACLVLAHTRADVNGMVRKHLGARRVSFASMEKALAETKMEYGGITPIGLPADWPILIDSQVISKDWVVIGSGIRGSKIILPGKILATLPNAEVLDGMAK